jgi:hypothetical protein
VSSSEHWGGKAILAAIELLEEQGSIENGIDVRLSTLERYVEALGGKLEIHAVFDDVDIALTA